MIQTGSENTMLLPAYYCQSGVYIATEMSPTKAISSVYKQCFNTTTRYSGYQIMGWNDNEIIEKLNKDVQFIPFNIKVGNNNIFIHSIGISLHEKWCYAGPGFQALLIHRYEKKLSVFVSRIDDKKCIVEIYQESTLKKQFIGNTPDEVWQKTNQLQKFTGVQLFGLDNLITKNLI